MVRVRPHLTRKSLALLTSLLLLLFWVPALIDATGASASTGTLVGGFEIDGNLVAGDMTPTAGLDWNSAFAAPQPTGRDPIGATDTSVYSNGTQDADPVTGWNVNASAGATGKGDIGDYYVAHRVAANNDDYAFFAIERDTSTGTVNYDVELNQHADVTNANGATVPCRQSGDVMLNVAQQGNNSFSLGAELFTWAPSGSTWTSSDASASTCTLGSWHDSGAVSSSNMVGVVNSTAIDPIDTQDAIAAENAGKIPANQFAEFAFDLTGTSLNTTCPGAHFGAINIRSVASTGGNPEVKDFATGPINILPACADLVINKFGPDGTTPLPGATFIITPNPNTGTGTLTVTDGDTNGPDTTADGVIEFDQAKPLASGAYSVYEDTAPTGYLLATPRTVDPYTDALAFNSYTYNFTDPLGSITFYKVNDVTGDPLGGATFHITPNPLPGGTGSFLSVTDNQAGDASSVAGTIEIDNAMVGSYTISESDPPTGFVADPTTRTAVVGDPQLVEGATANPVVTTAFRDPTEPSVTAVKSSDPASGTVADPTPVTPGQTITYTIAVSNAGSSTARDVVVTDAVPGGTTFVADSATVTGGTYDSASNTVSWTTNVPGGSTVNLHFQVTVNAGDGNGTLIDNTANFTNMHTPGCDSATCDTNTTHHEVEFPVLALAKSSNPVSGSIVQRGQRIDYTVTLTNSGLAASSVQTITDTLPSHVTVVSGSASPAFTSASGSTVTWDVTVPAQSTVTLTYAVTVDRDAPEGATLTNVALVNGQCVGNSDASACTTDHHVPTGALTLVKHVDKATASYGDTLTYTFDAATTGALNQTDVTVSDVMPAGTAYVAGSAACSDAGTCTTSFDAASKTLTWGLGDMAAGSTRHLVFKVTIVKPAFSATAGLPPATIVNSGAIQSTETPTTPSNQVVTKVVAVLGVKVVRAPKLPFTGLPAKQLGLLALLLVGAGGLLSSVRRREQ